MEPKDLTPLVPIITRVPRELRDDFQRIVKRDERSMAGELRRLIRAHVDADNDNAQQEEAA